MADIQARLAALDHRESCGVEAKGVGQGGKRDVGGRLSLTAHFRSARNVDGKAKAGARSRLGDSVPEHGDGMEMEPRSLPTSMVPKVKESWSLGALESQNQEAPSPQRSESEEYWSAWQHQLISKGEPSFQSLCIESKPG